MKTLLLLRHAKSSWKEERLSDFDRPLKGRGRRAAAKVGRLIEREGLMPEVVLCSPSVRTRQTCQRVMEACCSSVEPKFLDELYHCPAEGFPEILQQLPDDAQRILLIGHNPGLADFLASVSGVQDKFPTAALAWLTVELTTWRDFVAEQPMHLQNFWRPRDLE